MGFYPPSSEHLNGSMAFMLLGRARDKVATTDQTGRTAIYDAGSHAMRTAPSLNKPKGRQPFSVAVGDSLYVLGTVSIFTSDWEHCFGALVYGRVRDGFEDWSCHPLPPPPCHPSDVLAYTVVGGSHIWVSMEGAGTYSFDMARGAWPKQGDWELPFRGLAEYVPEYKLWFALSSFSREKNGRNIFLCASDLAGAASAQREPILRNVWEDLPKPPKEWLPYLVHLGSGRFCISRFFLKPHELCDMTELHEAFAVFTAVEVEPCGKSSRGLRMVSHKSKSYNLGYNHRRQWVL